MRNTAGGGAVVAGRCQDASPRYPRQVCKEAPVIYGRLLSRASSSRPRPRTVLGDFKNPGLIPFQPFSFIALFCPPLLVYVRIFCLHLAPRIPFHDDQVRRRAEHLRAIRISHRSTALSFQLLLRQEHRGSAGRGHHTYYHSLGAEAQICAFFERHPTHSACRQFRREYSAAHGDGDRVH